MAPVAAGKTGRAAPEPDQRLEVAALAYLRAAQALGADLDATVAAVRVAASTAAPPGSPRFS